MEIQARAEQFNARPSLPKRDRERRKSETRKATRGLRETRLSEDLELLFDMAMSDYRPLPGAPGPGRCVGGGCLFAFPDDFSEQAAGRRV